MAFEDLRDQLKEKFTEGWSKVQESPIYNNLREKYETMSPGAQLGLIVGTTVVAFLLILSIPLSYYTSSSDLEAEFNSNRSLIRDLLRASRLASDVTSLPQTPSASDLRNQIQNMLQNFSLQAEQIGPFVKLEPQSLNFANVVSTKAIDQEGLGVSLKKLNLNQTIDIGFELQKISPSVKMAGVEINASTPDPHYFDVFYKLIVFNMPVIETAEVDTTAGGSRAGRPAPRRGGKTSPDGDDASGDAVEDVE